MDENLLWILRQKGTIEIMIYLYEHKSAKYYELKSVIKKESTLIRDLGILLDGKLIRKEVLNEKYRPTKYFLTPRGREVARHLYNLFNSNSSFIENH